MPGLFFGFVCPQLFRLAEQDFTEAGGTLSDCDFLGIRGLLGWADERSVFVFVGFADCLLEGFFRCHGGAVAVVLRGYLQAVDEDPGAARINAVGGLVPGQRRR